jgi:hypothetical protein
MVERFFRDLSQQATLPGSFESIAEQLTASIVTFLNIKDTTPSGRMKGVRTRLVLVVLHVFLSFLQCRLGGSSTLSGDFKGSIHGAKETAHLRDIWHDLTVFHRCVKLAQKRVGFS